MSLTELSKYVFTDESADGRMKTIAWLQAHQLLATSMTCNCGTGGMNMVQRDRAGTQNDKWAWRCPHCSSIKSIRSGSWFEGTYISVAMEL